MPGASVAADIVDTIQEHCRQLTRTADKHSGEKTVCPTFLMQKQDTGEKQKKTFYFICKKRCTKQPRNLSQFYKKMVHEPKDIKSGVPEATMCVT